MIRLLLRLFGIKDFDTCKSCETLKAQLAFVNDEKKQLTETLLKIVSPKVVEAAPVELNQIQSSSALFSRRRAALEAKDRAEAQILRERKHVGLPDNIKDIKPIDTSVEQLEQELGLEEQKEA